MDGVADTDLHAAVHHADDLLCLSADLHKPAGREVHQHLYPVHDVFQRRYDSALPSAEPPGHAEHTLRADYSQLYQRIQCGDHAEFLLRRSGQPAGSGGDRRRRSDPGADQSIRSPEPAGDRDPEPVLCGRPLERILRRADLPELNQVSGVLADPAAAVQPGPELDAVFRAACAGRNALHSFLF